MANKKKKQRHLTLTDRIYIEQELVRGSNFTEIGKALRKDPSTIAKEVKLHYEVRKSSYNTHGCANCVIYADCIKQHLCGNSICNRKCKQCNLFRNDSIALIKSLTYVMFRLNLRMCAMVAEIAKPAIWKSICIMQK